MKLKPVQIKDNNVIYNKEKRFKYVGFEMCPKYDDATFINFILS